MLKILGKTGQTAIMLLKAKALWTEMHFSGQAWQQVCTADPPPQNAWQTWHKKKQEPFPRWNTRTCHVSPVMKGMEWFFPPKNKTVHLSRVYILATSPLTYAQTQLSKHRCLNDFLPLPNFFFFFYSSCQMLFVFKPHAYGIWGHLSNPAVELCTAGFTAVCGKD